MSLINIVDSNEFKILKVIIAYCLLGIIKRILEKEKDYTSNNGRWIIPVDKIEVI